MKKFLILLVSCILLITTNPSFSQEVLKIAAVVNNQIISLYDLNMRTKLVILFSGLSDNLETRKRMKPQVLQTMIDEELKLQEAKRIKLIIKDTEINNALRRIEKGNKLSKGFLKKSLMKQNIDISVLHKRIKAQISWRQLVEARYSSSIVITDEEVNENLAQIKKSEGKPEYLISDIFLPIDKLEDKNKVLLIANRMIEQIKSGASFSTLAKNFSKSPTAKNGGNMGWKRTGQLDPELENVLKYLKPEQISQPIPTIEGYYILYLNDRRIARKFGEPDPETAMINLQQLIVPIAKNAGKAEVEKNFNLVNKTIEKTKNCKDLELISKQIGSPLSGNLGDIKYSALRNQQKKMINKLPIMQASNPQRTPEGIMVLMVCRRDEGKVVNISADEQQYRIKRNLRIKRLQTFSQKFIQELRRNAFLEIRS
jgi:peptidyl-prolyl cis-trans isomerase SurA